MDFIQPKVNKSKGEIEFPEYEIAKVKFDLDNMCIGDNIEWHKHIGKMVSIDLMQETTHFKKLTTMVTKLENHLKQERVVNKARLVNIHYLEQRIISLGEDSNDKNGVKYLVK
jgi:hypothetical protein